MTRLFANDCDISALGTLGYFGGSAIADGGLTRVGFLHCREGKTRWTREENSLKSYDNREPGVRNPCLIAKVG